MTFWTRVVFSLNLGFCLFAVVANYVAAYKMPSYWRVVRAITGSLALIYAIGYIALLAGWVSVDAWSALFRGISPFAWLVVWAGPAIMDKKIMQALDSNRKKKNEGRLFDLD